MYSPEAPFHLFRIGASIFAYMIVLPPTLSGLAAAHEGRVPARTRATRFADDLRDAEPRHAKESPPHREREEAQTVTVRLHPQATAPADKVDERGLVRPVRGIRIVLVLDEHDFDVPAPRDGAGRRVLSERRGGSFDIGEAHAPGRR